MTLEQLLADAAARGLTHFSLSRMHSREAMWQASSRWTWSDGYRIAIQPSSQAAAAEALSARPVSDQRGRAAAPDGVDSVEVTDTGIFD